MVDHCQKGQGLRSAMLFDNLPLDTLPLHIESPSTLRITCQPGLEV